MCHKLSCSPFLAIAVFVLTLAAAHNVGAQSGAPRLYQCDPPCGGDTTVWPWVYPTIPFSAPLYINGCQFNNPPSCCTVTSWYRWRQVCRTAGDPGLFQIEITSISWDKACAPAFDPVPMLKVITYGLLALDPMNLPPRIDHPNDPCMQNYSVQAAICWRNEPGMNSAVNCAVDTGGFACCKGGYSVCLVMGPNGLYREITWLGQSTTMNNCIAPCMPSCGAFESEGGFNRPVSKPPGFASTPRAPETTGTAIAATIPATTSAVSLPGQP